jgi:hypothetical protein
VHLELINSWDVLESVLTARFRNIAGERKVKQGEYALQDRLSMRDIERSQPFEANFLPGRKIDMSIIFSRRQPTGNSCPGCKMESKSNGATATTWYVSFLLKIYHLLIRILVMATVCGIRGLKK